MKVLRVRKTRPPVVPSIAARLRATLAGGSVELSEPATKLGGYRTQFAKEGLVVRTMPSARGCVAWVETKPPKLERRHP